MAGLYTHVTRATGTILTATIYNTDHQNHIDNQTPQMTDDYSATVAQMQSITNPGGIGTESLATSLSGELERLRYRMGQLHGSAQWYAREEILIQTAAGVDVLTFPIPSWADELEATLYDIIPLTTNKALQAQISIAAAYKTDATYGRRLVFNTAGTRSVSYASTDNAFTLTSPIRTLVNPIDFCQGILTIRGLRSTTAYKKIFSHLGYVTNGGAEEICQSDGGLYAGSAGALDGIRFNFESAVNFNGTVAVRFRRNS